MVDKYFRMNSSYNWVEVTKDEYLTSLTGDPGAPNNRGIIHTDGSGAKFYTLSVAFVSPEDIKRFMGA